MAVVTRILFSLQWVSGGYQGRSSWLVIVSFCLETHAEGWLSNVECPMSNVQCS